MATTLLQVLDWEDQERRPGRTAPAASETKYSLQPEQVNELRDLINKVVNCQNDAMPNPDSMVFKV